MSEVAGNFVQGLAGLVEAMSPLTDMIGQAFGGLSQGFADFASNTKPGSPLEQFISYTKQALPAVGHTLEAIGSALGHIVAAAAPVGLVVLSVLKSRPRC
jgi:hypothetical protein